MRFAAGGWCVTLPTLQTVASISGAPSSFVARLQLRCAGFAFREYLKPQTVDFKAARFTGQKSNSFSTKVYFE